ncbi:HlyD family secretion protein [Desulfosediminicola flagellatus]|uniref:HlyD family secretion protein n=1 Tax=Desulfosediminicola flagellatus TaxID=2569541 RepID=UPI0010AC1A49|nr:HlyD family secretion protein [Desulfosediminicola flagellatus]
MSDDKKNPDSAVENSASTAPEKGSGSSAVTSWTTAIIIACIAIFTGHIMADKYTPYTSNARIEAFVVPIVPEVSGTLNRVNVTNNQLVTNDEVLAVIDSTKYELAVRRAEADLQLATQSSEADISSVTTAQAKVAEAEANLRNAEVKGKRIIKLSTQGAASVSRADDARSRIEANKAKLASARSELEKAKSNLGNTGKDNARVRSALVALETAQLDLARSSIQAPSNGIITNLTIDVGHYASIGSPLMTFISTRFVWIQADMRENCLMNMKAGNPVELVLDAAPGRVFNGEVMSVGYGVSDNVNNTLGGLTTVQPTQGWLRQAQHMPVLIQFSDDASKNFKRVGGQVNVIIYTGDNSILNFLGKFWIRMISIVSHVY